MTPIITQYGEAALGSRFSSPEDHKLDFTTDTDEYWKTSSIPLVEIFLLKVKDIPAGYLLMKSHSILHIQICCIADTSNGHCTELK